MAFVFSIPNEIALLISYTISIWRFLLCGKNPINIPTTYTTNLSLKSPIL